MLTVNVDSRLTDDNLVKVAAVLTKYNVRLVDLVKEIESNIDDESLAIGAEWYREANAFARELSVKHSGHEQDFDVCAAVISALSPRMGWVRNKEMADHVIGEYLRLREVKIYRPQDIASKIKGALGASIRMAVDILSGKPIDEALTGVKRRSFYNNIVTAGESDDVTIDTWMQRAVMHASEDKGMDLDESANFLKARNHSGYIALADSVRRVAELRNVSPATVQAAYWIGQSGSVHGWHWKGKGITEARTY